MAEEVRTELGGSLGPRAGSPQAAAAVWQWRDAGPDPAHADPARERLGGALRSLVMFVFGGVVFWIWSPTIGLVIFGLAGFVLLAALVSPTGLYGIIRSFLRWLGYYTGQGLGWLLLVPLYYLAFFPFGQILRRGRRDRLKRYFDADAVTYWEPHEGPTAASNSRRRQY